MGNAPCYCEKTIIENAPSIKNSGILKCSEIDQVLDCNSNYGDSAQNSFKLTQKNKNLTKLKLKYGARNLIEEEDTSNIYKSVYSELVNNSIFHQSSIISDLCGNSRNENFNSKNSQAGANSDASQQSAGANYGSNNIFKTSFQSSNDQSTIKNKRQQMALDVYIQSIMISNPEGDRIKQGQKIILRHLNSEMNLHSHFRKQEKGNKLQEVSACQSKRVHDHDHWIIDIPENRYENLNQSNRIWAQIGRFHKTEETMDSYSIDMINVDEQNLRSRTSIKCLNRESESLFFKSPYILNEDDVIFKHCVTQKELGSSNKFIDLKQKTQQVFCDDLSNNYQNKESFNWRIMVNNSDGVLRDNSIIQIVHSETSKPLRTNKQNGILSQTVQVACRNNEYSDQNRQINDYWIINRVYSNSAISKQNN